MSHRAPRLCVALLLDCAGEGDEVLAPFPG
jgi:hypothetical protein